MIALVTGSRDWTDRDLIAEQLANLEATEPRLVVVEGGAPGADRCAAGWANRAQGRGVGWQQIQAKWEEHHPDWCPGAWCAAKRHCVGAGHRRNEEMLDWVLEQDDKTVLVLAFKDGFDLSKGKGGTEDMVRRAKDAGLSGRVFAHST